jgi:DNA-binding IscR family transcriptional regulator
VRGYRPELTTYDGAAEHLQRVWVAVRASLRSVLEKVTLTDVISGKLPAHVQKMTTDPDAWVAH